MEGHGYDGERNFYVIRLGEMIKIGKVNVSIDYTGFLNDDLVGFYKSSYITSESGEKKWMAVTQFESTDARRAFPCFDEPSLKATFQVNLGRLPGMSSISNMPKSEEGVPIPGTDYVWDIYEESLRMSTYLVAFVVSEFAFRFG